MWVDVDSILTLSVRQVHPCTQNWFLLVTELLKLVLYQLLNQSIHNNSYLSEQVYRPFSYCIDYGDLNGLGHLPEFADQIFGLLHRF